MQKKILIVGMVIILLLNAILIGNVNAMDSKITVVNKGRCQDLLKYNGVTVGCVRVAYNDGYSDFPAYCLQRDLPGIGDRTGEYSSYDLDVTGYITNPMIWRIISNSFPCNSMMGMGVNNIEEAYVATKQAIYCVLYGNDADDFSRYTAIGAAGERTLNAMKKLVNIARNSTDTMPSKVINIETINSEWIVDEIDSNYISKTYLPSANAVYFVYNVKVDKTILPEGAKIVNLNNEEVENFRAGEKFKILIPINHNKNISEFEIMVSAEVGTSPVYFGDAKEGLQDYALAAYGYEDGVGVLKEKFIKNNSKIIIIKKDGKTNEYLKNTEFNVLDENKNVKFSNLITNEEGTVIIEGIEPGKYYLQEVRATEGYQKTDKLVEFDMDLNKEMTITITNNKISKEEISINTGKINVEVENSETNINIKDQNKNINDSIVNNNIEISTSTTNENSTNIKNDIKIDENTTNKKVTSIENNIAVTQKTDNIEKTTVINTVAENQNAFVKKLPKTGC